MGCIKALTLKKNSALVNDFSVGDKVEAELIIDIPESADLKGLSVSLGLKDKNGLDIFVTSSDDKNIIIGKKGKIKVSISFMNYLNKGTYTVIAALENRATAPISYYDYIEGAAYLKVGFERELFGFVQLPSEVDVSWEGESL